MCRIKKMPLVQSSYVQQVSLQNFLKLFHLKVSPRRITLHVSSGMVFIRFLKFSSKKTVMLPFSFFLVF